MNPSSNIPAPTGQTHTVQEGEVLSGIAALYGVTTEAMMSANGLGNPNLIYPGQVLNIPAPGPSVPEGWKTHTVSYGETLASIAARYGLTVEAIMAANGLSSPDAIYPGQVLKIPPALPPVGPVHHTVRYGETLGGIAQTYGVPLPALMTANGLSNPNLVNAGQVLTIPLPLPTATYTVLPGENLSLIAVKFGLTLEALATMNAIYPPYTVVPGQVLRVPPAGPGSPTPQPGYQTYTVPPTGEPFFAIAVKLGVSQEALAAANGMQPPYATYPGQVLKIPVVGTTTTGATTASGGGASPRGAGTTTASPPDPLRSPAISQQARTHTVLPGESIVSVALKYGTSIEALAAVNGLQPPYPVTPGQVLRLP